MVGVCGVDGVDGYDVDGNSAQCSRWAFFIYLRSMRKKNSNQIFFGGLCDYLFILDEHVMFSLCPRYEKNKIVKVNKMFAQIQTKWT